MATLRKHWTERSVDDFAARISLDFVQQLDDWMESSGVSHAALARKLGVTKGRVSQVFNNPGNLSLKTMVQYARALGRKVTVVAYDDGDSNNLNGPVNAYVFAACWQMAGKPTDAFGLEMGELAGAGTDVIEDAAAAFYADTDAAFYWIDEHLQASEGTPSTSAQS